jgi:hypothetical protein
MEIMSTIDTIFLVSSTLHVLLVTAVVSKRLGTRPRGKSGPVAGQQLLHSPWSIEIVS